MTNWITITQDKHMPSGMMVQNMSVGTTTKCLNTGMKMRETMFAYYVEFNLAPIQYRIFLTDLILFMQVTHGLDSAIALDHISVVYVGFEQSIGTVCSVISRTTPATGRSNVLTATTGARERTTCRVISAGYIKIYSESSYNGHLLMILHVCELQLESSRDILWLLTFSPLLWSFFVYYISTT